MEYFIISIIFKNVKYLLILVQSLACINFFRKNNYIYFLNMVTFECGTCIRVLKKKQIEKHYMFECRNSQQFCCLTCFKNFDRDSVKAHIACVTEEEKYQKGDNTNKKNISKLNEKKEVVPVDMEKLKWSGFRKTAKKILMAHENHKLGFKELFEKLALVYAKNNGVQKEEVCLDLVKKHTISKIEDNDKFVIDLGKSTIRYKA